MKTLLINLFLLSLIVSGYQYSKDKTSENNINSNDFRSVQEVNAISKDEALNIALKDTKLTKDKIKNLKIEFDDSKYDIEFNSDKAKFDYEVHAFNSQIVQKEKEDFKVTPSIISKDKALSIALKDAKLTKDKIKNLKVELDDSKYDIEFNSNKAEFDYEIHAFDSHIIKKEKEDFKVTPSIISKDKALSIALKHVGLSKDKIRDLEIELDKNIYEIDFDDKQIEYSFDINAANGKIIEFEKDR